jgi:hypothetical protein
MGAVVPAGLAQVDASQERLLTVYDHELLVVTAAGRVGVVEAKQQPYVGGVVEPQALHPLALQREHHVEVPGQQVYAQRWRTLAQPVQELDQLHLLAATDGVRPPQQLDPAIELPPGDQDVLPGAQGGRMDGAVVVGSVHDHARVDGTHLFPDVLSRRNDVGCHSDVLNLRSQ